MEASPGDGAGVEGDQLAADGREGHLDALQVLQQEQDTAVTHCRGTQQSAQALCRASLTCFPRTGGHRPSHFMLSGPFATRTSCSRRQTSHCFPVSPLGHVHSPVRGSQEPPLHSHSAGLSNRESFCAFTTGERGTSGFIPAVLIYTPLPGVSLCNPATCTGPQTAASCFPPSTTAPAPQPRPGAPGWDPALTCAAALAEAPVARGTLVAARAADAGQAAALAALHVAAAPHGAHVAVTPPAARASLEAIESLLGKSRTWMPWSASVPLSWVSDVGPQLSFLGVF